MSGVELLTDPTYGVGVLIEALATAWGVGFAILAVTLVYRRTR